ncbi:MAG: flagellar basal body rod protein FlgB [Phycisphaerae bacterium]
MWLDRILSSKTTNALALSVQFTERRQQVLAENIANIDTTDYHTKRLDVSDFQSALKSALDAQTPRTSVLELRGRTVETTAAGHLLVEPETEPAPNILFHDGTNARLEELMTDAASNSLYHEFAVNLLQTRLDGLFTAIRGRIQ